MEASPSDVWKWMADTLKGPSIADVINLPKPTHVHKWEWEAVDRDGFGCEAPGCDVHWLDPEAVETLLNEHFSTLGVKYENVPNLSRQAVYSQVTTPWAERQA